MVATLQFGWRKIFSTSLGAICCSVQAYEVLNAGTTRTTITGDCYGRGHDIFEIEALREITWQQAQLSDATGEHLLGLTDTFQASDGDHERIAMHVLACTPGIQPRRSSDYRAPIRMMKQLTRQLLVGLAVLHDKCRVMNTGTSVARLFDVSRVID